MIEKPAFLNPNKIMDPCNNYDWLTKPTGKRYGLYLSAVIDLITTKYGTTRHFVPPEATQ